MADALSTYLRGALYSNGNQHLAAGATSLAGRGNSQRAATTPTGSVRVGWLRRPATRYRTNMSALYADNSRPSPDSGRERSPGAQ